jgi:hypothetical protein
MTLPTPRTSLAAHLSVNAYCAHCSNCTPLDLAELIRAGRGDVPLLELRLRCTRCRQFGHTVLVSGQSFAGQSSHWGWAASGAGAPSAL